jgi:hypothetical protein
MIWLKRLEVLIPLALAGTIVPSRVQAQAPAEESVVFLFQEVDRKPHLSATRVLYYPRGHSVGGASIELLAVIDTMGLAEAGSLKIVRATDSSFASAARMTLLSQQFTPGLFRGRKVRVLMQQNIRFDPKTVSCTSPVESPDGPLCADSTGAKP